MSFPLYRRRRVISKREVLDLSPTIIRAIVNTGWIESALMRKLYIVSKVELESKATGVLQLTTSIVG